MNQTLLCCGYTNPEAVKWNPHNQVVQCHNCGQVYTPQRQPLTQEQRDAIALRLDEDGWYRVEKNESIPDVFRKLRDYYGIKGEA